MSETPRTERGDAPLYLVPSEVARQLESALRAFCEAFTNRGETTSIKEWNDRMKAAHDNAREALAGRLPYSEPEPNG